MHPRGVKTKDKAGRTPLVAAACRDVFFHFEDDEYDLDMIRFDVFYHLFRRSPSDGIEMAHRLLGDDDVRLPIASCSRVTSSNKKRILEEDAEEDSDEEEYDDDITFPRATCSSVISSRKKRIREDDEEEADGQKPQDKQGREAKGSGF